MPNYSGIWTVRQQFQAIGSVGWPSQIYPWLGVLYDASYDNQPSGVGAINDGNVYFSSYVANSVGATSIEVVQYAKDGTLNWKKSIGNGTNVFVGQGAVVDSSSNVFVSGRYSTGGPNAYFLIKYNSSGVLQWQRALASGGNDQAPGVAADGSGNVYIAGRSNSGAGQTLAKYNSSGTLQWQRTLSATSINIRNCAADSSGNVYVVASMSGGALLIKYDTSGTLQWQRLVATPAGASFFILYGVTAASSGNVYVSGYNYLPSGAAEGYVLKYNSSGVLQWQQKLGGATEDSLTAVAVDASENVYVGGSSNVSGIGAYNAIIAKYNSSGTLQWQRLIGSSANDYGGQVVVANNVVYSIIATYAATIIRSLLTSLPTDGSKTGTYTVGGYSYTYTASSFASTSGSLTESAGSATDAAGTMTGSTTTYTSSTSTLTSSITTL